MHSHGTVIPGRAAWREPESITPVFEFNIHTPAQGVWIPGLRQEAHPAMTMNLFLGAALFLEIFQRAAGENAILRDQLIGLDVRSCTKPRIDRPEIPITVF